MKVERGSQLIVHAPDQAGELAKVMKLVSDAGVNIRAYAGWVAEGTGRIILITEDNPKAVSLISEAGFEVREELVALVSDSDVVGAGSSQTQRIASAGINLTSVFATTMSGGEYLTVFQTDDVDGLVEALK